MLKQASLFALTIAALASCQSGPAPDQLHAVPAPAPPPLDDNHERAVPPPPKEAPKPVAPPPAPPTPVTTVEGITEYRLDNGLRVLLYPDDSQAKLTVSVTYMVGSRHEGYGETGMAHLLEHMMFKGTLRHPHVWEELQTHTSNNNANTSEDRTSYFEVLPATDANLDFALEMEADRMVNSNIAPEDLSKEFTVVRNEFERGENAPDNILYERMLSTAYLWHNYGKSTIGSQSDIERVPAETLRRFYKKFYQPDNAMLVIAGKFDAKHALELVQRYYGVIPRPERKLEPTYSVEPVQDGERQVILRRTGDVQVVGVVYHTVAGPDSEFVATEALAFLMTDEPAGRLYQALVKTGMASSVQAFSRPAAEPGTIVFFASVPAGKPIEPVRDKLLATVEGLDKFPPTADEIAKFKARQAKDFELAMGDSGRVSLGLSNWAAQGDWRLLFVHRDRVAALVPADVTKVAREYLKQSNRTIGIFYPTPAPERSPLPAPVDVAALVKDYKGNAAVAQGEAFDATVDNIEKRTTRVTLAGGLKLALLPKQTHGNGVKARLTLHFGTEKDLLGHEEAADLVSTMLLRGSKKHTYQQLRDELDRLKAQVMVVGGEDGEANVVISTVRDNLPAVLTLVTEILEEPTFPRDQLDIVKKERLAALEEQRTDPAAQARLEAARRLHPWPATDIRYIPTTEEQIERLKAVSLDDVKRLHKSLWGASHAELTIVGDFDVAAARAVIDPGLGAWKSERPFERIAVPYRAVASDQLTIDTPDKRMAQVIVVAPVELRDDDADYPALVLTNQILGSGFTSRLVDRLRQKEGWSYGTSSSLAVGDLDKRAEFRANAICAPQNAAKALAAMLEEIDRLVKDGVPAAELASAQESFKQKYVNRLADDRYLVGALNRDLYLGRTMEFEQHVADAIAHLTPADIRRVLDKHYLRTDALVKIMAGDLKKPAAMK